ncbi:MAG: hypothetical protein HOQ17_11140 [Gemmatimonadaceae bacterium]|nr:hypothetical protein [Gemmatimonadaceae bacterium]NUO96236.1 hypothetical protein [Gemmatimonadaceae bacterium]NUP55699.1 hypothetical protein [Gemmatimonadaceae bacterium]NUP72179.1 hypothetical protein [Gemmatimonadaceae bacterium]NUR35688.1 hypothetical protein [Gemmatimonadaceae bacterium]
MNRFILSGRIRAAATLCALVGSVTLIQACSNLTDPLLEAKDPDPIDPAAVLNADGAIGLYNGALGRLRAATAATDTSLQEPSWLFSGLLADEWSTSSTFVQNDEVDERSIKLDNSSVRNIFRSLARVRTATDQAIAGLQTYVPNDKVKLGEMYFARGFAEMQMAQDFCNGIPLSDASTPTFAFGQPLPVAEVFKRAAASYDTALAFASGTDAASVDIARAARIGKARALLGLGKAAEAAALVTTALVPTSYSYDITFSTTGGSNAIWGQGASQRRYTVGDSVEGNKRNLLVKNAIPFFSLQDPRLPVKYTVTVNAKDPAKRDTTKSQDGFTFSRTTTLYGQLTSIALVNGLDARLIEAEAKLVANDFVGMTGILNALRAAPPKVGDVQATAAQLPPLPVPATRGDAITQYFREKALWTFSRGQRLGDMRRLVRDYKLPVDQVFPIGTHYRGGTYGPDVNMPVPKDEEKNNPNFNGCLDRSA